MTRRWTGAGTVAAIIIGGTASLGLLTWSQPEMRRGLHGLWLMSVAAAGMMGPVWVALLAAVSPGDLHIDPNKPRQERPSHGQAPTRRHPDRVLAVRTQVQQEPAKP